MRAAVAMGADIDDEGAGRRCRSRRRRAGTARRARRPPPSAAASRPPCARHEADIERADARGRGVQHAEAVPAVLDGAELDARPWPPAPATAAPSGRASAPCPTMISGRSAFFERLGEAPLAVGELGQRLRAGAEIVVVDRSGRPSRRSAPIGRLPARQRLRMRALSTAASRRGLEPMISSASACSMPAMVGVEEIARAARAPDRARRRPGGSRCSASRAAPSDP